MTELLEWRDYDTSSEITYTGFGPYMVERLSADAFRIWLPDDNKNASIMVGGFSCRKDARAACQSNVDVRRSAASAVPDVVSTKTPIKPFSTYPEIRDKMLVLCAAVEKSCDDESAVELADLVKGILEDEAFA